MAASPIPYDDTRADWGARKPARGGHPYVGPDAKVGVTAHWSGNRTFIEPADPHSRCLTKVNGWQDFHMDVQGWRDLGYQTLVCVHGRIIEGSAGGPYTAGACNAGANTPWTCLQFMRGENESPINDAMRAAGVRVYEALRADTGRTLKRNGHRDVVDTACPGDVIYAWWTAPTLTGGEEDMALDTNDAALLYDYFMGKDSLKAPAGYPGSDLNPFWTLQTHVVKQTWYGREAMLAAKEGAAAATANSAAIAALASLIQTTDGTLDPARVEQIVREEIRAAVAARDLVAPAEPE